MIVSYFIILVTQLLSMHADNQVVKVKEEVAKDLLRRRPEVIIERAIKGMLPKNRLGRKMYKKLFVYVGDQHPHTAQQPKELKF